ncbi:L-threonine ammonia-lyase [Arboricoccus pini]|uniref:L-threonine ammonia-lyase n=1 Tax=Arboricoccus pini TaxID=1963835 RepID=A0A212QPI7_9PROT|nr:threonine/serine dehydratase [Arboricoccus pini]SNB61340.1 L-threonine ammonia-lyase [Arboricoccus pini]
MITDPEPLPVAYEDVEAAATRLRGVAVCTPLIENDVLNELTGGRVLVKAEPLQRTGSFKFRGAYNAIAQTEARAVVAFSSGNHAQGVAAAARLLGRKATIIMPADAPRLKLDNTRALGAEVILYDRFGENREAIGARVSEETGAELIRPYDDPRVMAGQGTIGLEIVAQAAARDLRPDAAIVCCGGGGLIAGTSTALTRQVPGIEVFSAEPEAFDDTARSLQAGERLANPPGRVSICDALMSPEPGLLTFQVNRRLLKGGLTASEDAVRSAMRFAFSALKVTVEPGGAIALAALMSGAFDAKGRVVAVVLSGGNVDPGTFAAILAGD